MKHSRQALDTAYVLIVVGIGLTVVASIQIPYMTFLGIRYNVNANFEFLFLWGVLFLVLGLGTFLSLLWSEKRT
jgi:hypothetical protein